MDLEVSSQLLSVGELPPDTASIDVCFDGSRVWSIDVRERDVGQPLSFDWPTVLTPYLKGSSLVSIIDSGSGAEIYAAEIHFDESGERVVITDDSGLPLSVNKWGLLGRALDAGGEELHVRILDETDALIKLLRDWDMRPFIVGGTLLGAVREGSLLPHDDDADIAYLSRFSDPADVAREGFAVGRRLESAGYEVVRHSAAHIQVLFRDSAGRVDHHLDVFAAFFTVDGNINQPFHVRGKMREDQMLPFRSVSIDGREYPAPADTDQWLTLNYDENWRTPLPGYILETPPATSRRFNAWFGSFNFRREFWDNYYSKDSADPDRPWKGGAGWVLTQGLESEHILELGCGSGELSAALIRPGREVIATDFSAEARLRARRASPHASLRVEHLNLYRRTSIAGPTRFGISGSFDIVANHLLEQIGHLGRKNALRLVRMALRSGGVAVATLYELPSADVSHDDPTTWHLDREDLAVEARGLGLGVDFYDIDPAPAESTRHPYGVIFSLGTPVFPTKELTMKERLQRLRSRISSPPADEKLLRRIEQLEAEIDELRANNLRAAELLDLVEEQLTPPKR